METLPSLALLVGHHYDDGKPTPKPSNRGESSNTYACTSYSEKLRFDVRVCDAFVRSGMATLAQT